MTDRETAIQIDFRAMLELPAARRVIGNILSRAFRDATTLVLGSPEHTAYNEGLREASNRIANAIREIDPFLLAQCEKDYADFERLFKGEEEDEEDDLI